MIDLVKRKAVDLTHVKTIILDEQSDLLVTAIDKQKTKIEQLESEPIKVEPTTPKNAKQNILNKIRNNKKNSILNF